MFGISTQAASPNHVPHRVLVKFKSGTGPAQIQEILARHQAQSEKTLDHIDVQVLKLPAEKDEQAVVDALKRRPEVEFAELDRILLPQALTPNDFFYTYGLQWALPKILAPDAWSLTTGNASLIIAIIDTGVDGTHEDLSSKMVPGWNAVDNSAIPVGVNSDVTGHGTAVAGVAAASTNNSIGVAGVCWDCQIMPIRIMNPGGSASDSAIASGITWAADHGAKVANSSFGGPGSAAVSSAAQYMQSKGGAVVAASGDSSFVLSTPHDPYILTVGATDANDVIYSWSDTGPVIDLVAPGCVYTTGSGNSYASGCGTSYSAPIVAGVVALILSANPNLTPTQVTNVLKQTAVDLGVPGCDTTYGCGRVNALAAVTTAAGGPPPPPVITSALTATGTISTAFMYQITATNSPTNYNATDLPFGLSMNTATGLISGTPLFSGSFSVALSATNNGGTVSATLSLTINPGTTSPCDVNGDGATNVVDVQQDVNAALGTTACSSTFDINKDTLCNVIDVQRVVNAALGGQCVSP